MRMRSIASGSSGNAIYVGTDNTHLLVDAGISGKRIEEGLRELDLCGKDLDGILITHEHSDHIGGLGVLLRKCPMPVYATQETIDAILAKKELGKVDWEFFNPIEKDKDFCIKDLQIRAMRISHDAANPVMYRFSHNGVDTAIATDLGEYDDYTIQNLMGLRAIYLEANHDLRMLQTGPYPYPLKQRVSGKCGHLSNESAGRLLSAILNDDMEHIFLSHLSKENNLPELAYEAVRLEVEMADTPYHGDDFNIEVARRSEPSPIIQF